MSNPVKMIIKYRSDIIDDSPNPNVDLPIEVIEFNRVILDGETDKVESFQRDPWEGLSVEEAIIHKVLPNGREKWEVQSLPDDTEWEGQIMVYHTKEIL